MIGDDPGASFADLFVNNKEWSPIYKLANFGMALRKKLDKEVTLAPKLISILGKPVILIGVPSIILVIYIAQLFYLSWQSTRYIFLGSGYKGLAFLGMLMFIVIALIVVIVQSANDYSLPSQFRPLFTAIVARAGGGTDSKHPDNTLFSLREAYRIGVQTSHVELWYLHRDRTVIAGSCSADSKEEAIAEGEPWFPEMSLLEARQLFLGTYMTKDGATHRYRVPTLLLVLKHFRDTATNAVLELRGPGWTCHQGLRILLQAIYVFKLSKLVKIASVEPADLNEICNLDSSIPLSLMFHKRKALLPPGFLKQARLAGAWEVVLRHDDVTENLVKDIRLCGLDACAYFQKDSKEPEAELERLINAKVASIITNHPCRLKNLLDRMRGAGESSDDDDAYD